MAAGWTKRRAWARHGCRACHGFSAEHSRHLAHALTQTVILFRKDIYKYNESDLVT